VLLNETPAFKVDLIKYRNIYTATLNIPETLKFIRVMYSMIQHITLGDEIKISRPVFNLNVNKNCPPRNNKIPNTI